MAEHHLAQNCLANHNLPPIGILGSLAMGKRPKSHRVDQRAQAIFRSSIPDEWLISEPTQGYGVDYAVQVFDGDAPTDLIFEVQLKGTETAPEGRPRKQLRTSDIVEWSTTRPCPVVVVLVVNEQETVYWRTAADIVLDVTASDYQWKERDTKTIDFSKFTPLSESRQVLVEMLRTWATDRRSLRTDQTGMLFVVDDYLYASMREPLRLPFSAQARFAFLSTSTGVFLGLSRSSAMQRDSDQPHTRVQMAPQTPVLRLKAKAAESGILQLLLVDDSTEHFVGTIATERVCDLNLSVDDGQLANLWLNGVETSVKVQIDHQWDTLILGAQPCDTGPIKAVSTTPGVVFFSAGAAEKNGEGYRQVLRYEFPTLEPRLDMSGFRNHLHYPQEDGQGPLSTTNDPLHLETVPSLSVDPEELAQSAWRVQQARER